MLLSENQKNKLRGKLSEYGLLIKRRINPPKNYKLVFSDEFKGNLDLNTWRYGFNWGDFHPDYPYQYYDNSGECVYNSDGILNLSVKNIPKEFKHNHKIIIIPYATGLITSRKDFHYGWFEAQIRLPKGKYLWNSYWLGGSITWPPEADIFEGYSGNDGLYKKRCIKNCKIQPNLHFGNITDGSKSQYKPYDVRVKNAADRFVTYVCHWEKEFIRIYYDRMLIFECKDKKILEYYNRRTDKMMIILGNGLRPDYKEDFDEIQPFQIKYVKVYQKK